MSTLVPLGQVASIFNGKTPSKSEQRDKGHPVLKIKDVDESGMFKGEFTSFVDVEFAEKHHLKSIELDDTLILNAAHNSDYVGSKQYRAALDVVGSIATGEWLVARANSVRLHPRYLNYWLASNQARFFMKTLVKGIHLYPKDVARLEIPLPSLAEQQRIAAILDQADALRRKRQQAIDLADQFLRSVFLEMFGDPVTNPKGWDDLPLSDLILSPLQNGAYYPKDLYVSTGVEMVHMSDAFYDVIKRGALKRVAATEKDIEKYALAESDVLISRRSLNLEGAAKPSLIPRAEEPLIFESSMIRVTPNQDKLLPGYLFAFLGHPLVKAARVSKYVTGATIKGISQSNLAKVKVLVPPINIQKDFVRIMEWIESLKEKWLKNESEIDLAFSAISQKAFRGDL